MFKIKTGIFVSFVSVLTFILLVSPLDTSAHTNESLDMSTITQEPFIEVNSTPRSIQSVVFKTMYKGLLVYHEVNVHGSLYQGYVSYINTNSAGHYRYSGTLYRHDLPYHPIPTKNTIELELNQ